MQSTPDDVMDQSPLELRPSNRGLRVLGLVHGVAGIYFIFEVIWPKDQLQFVVGCVGCAFVASAAVFLLTAAARTHVDAWRVRLDNRGVTVRGNEVVPWSDLIEVRLSLLSGKSSVRVVAFVPRPGVTLPAVPTALLPFRDRARAISLTERFGSPIVVNPVRMGLPTNRIVAAVERLSDLPVVLA
ncbi:hypothetical protein [Streptacidiphilus sp. EB103A]|uniref:hypothetical protein n=1 Tax=Streptacidiphilus sp. EB103A TaxID=3156275 RepID=UPI003514D0B7